MRRRRDRYGSTPASLLPSALPVYTDDLSLTLRERLERWKAWMAEYEAWSAARTAWAAGDDEVEIRLSIEASALIPDAPFDPNQV